VGGFFGAASRFGINQLTQRYLIHPFPVATLIVNVVGSFLIGFLYEYFRDHPSLPYVTLFLVVGFLGAFTTFSAFSFETIGLVKRGELQLASLNTVGNVALCLIGVIAGEWLAKLLSA
jgi:CrcB protein